MLNWGNYASCFSRQINLKNFHLLRFKSTQQSLTQQHSSSIFFSSLLNSANNPGTLRKVHAQIVASGATNNVYICNYLVKAYISLGLISYAQKSFDQIPKKNVVSWTILISGFSKRRLFDEAVASFGEMLSTGLEPNELTFSSILPAFANLGLNLIGKSAHGFWVRRGFEHNVIVETCLVDMYSRFGCMGVAQAMFDEMPERSIVSWNVIIAGYASKGMGGEALKLFNLMRENVGFVDHVTFMSLLSGASGSTWGRTSSAVHGLIVRSGCNNEQHIQTDLIKMYTSCKLIDEAQGVFCEMSVNDVVAWTLMLEGFSSCQQWSKAIKHFTEMMSVHGMALDSTAIVSILSSCSGSGALLHGRRVHALVMKQGFGNNVYVGSALIDMYANCGDVDSGKRFFDGLVRKDIVCWNAMIKAMGSNGNGGDAIGLLWRMEVSGFKPNESTIISALTACSHAGMIDDGLQIFCHMVDRWGIVPSLQHYACLVDLLGRSGRLDEAHSVMIKMPMHPHPELYGALLSACKTYGNTELGADIFQQLRKLDLKDPGHFCSVLNMYASVGDWTGVEMSNLALRLEGLKKDPGYSFTELSNQVTIS